MEKSYRAQLEIQKYKGQKKWFIEVPIGNQRRELEIVRQATREPDPVPLFEPMSRLRKELIALFSVAALFFLLAYEIGLAGWIYSFF